MRSAFLRNMLYLMLAVAAAGHAQEFPSKPITIVVPTQPGGTSDHVARIIAAKFKAKWGQTVIVDNRAGAAGNIGAAHVAKSPPDGYTLLFTPQFPLVINKSLYPKLSYDPNRLVPVTIALAGDMALVVKPSLDATTVQQLINRSKSSAGQISYASAGSGSMGHLMFELFNSMSGAQGVHVPYKGGAPAMVDVMGGQVDAMFVDLGTALAHVRAGRLRLLAISSEKRNPALPDVPTVAETIPGFVFTSWFGMVAPPGTPPALAEKLAAVAAEAIREPDVAPRLRELGIKVVASGPDEMARVMASDRAIWSKVVHDSGATSN
jgi:tripartite-type tricarboxylate transporter receptor subunit TctC